MPAPGTMQSEFAINGSFGEVYTQDGDYLAEVQRVEATIRVGRRDIMVAGSRKTRYKAMNVMGEGQLATIKVTSRFDEIVSEMIRSDRQLQRILTLRVKVDDPEALGVEEYRLAKVKLWELSIGFNVNDIIEQTIPFTFEEYEPVQWIRGNSLVSQHASRYQALS